MKLMTESATKARRTSDAMFALLAKQVSHWHNHAVQQETRAEEAIRIQFKVMLKFFQLHAQQRKGPATKKQRTAKLDELISQYRESGMKGDQCYETIKREFPELILGRRRERTDRERPIMDKSEVFRQFRRRSRTRAA
jgi:hypothetical protein